MLKKNFNYFTMFATGLFFCVLGFSFIFDSLAVWNWLYTTLVIGISVAGVIRIFNMILNYRKLKHKGGQFLDIIVWLIAIIISLAIPETFFAIFPRLIGCWILLHAIIKIIVFYIKIKDRLPIPFMKVIFLCGDLIIAFFLIVNPGAHEDVISFFLGAYFLIYGGNTLLDLIREILPSGSGDKLDQKIQLSVPPVLSAVIPPHLMSTLLNKDKEDEIKVLVSVEDYFAFEIKKDGVIHQSVLEELQLREKVLKAWRLCIRKISTKDRTRKEMYDILVEDGSLDIKQINDMIDKLEDKGYVNDTLYMFNQIEHKQRSLEGKGKIIRDLVKRGLPYESVSEALDTLGDATEKTKAFHYAQKLQLSIKGQSLKMKKQKMKQRLIVQGYSPTLADEVIAQMDFNEEAGEQAALLEKAIQKALKTYSKKYDGQELKNAILRSLIRKGFTSEDVLIAINGMEIFK